MALTAAQLLVKIGADTAGAERGMRSVSEHLGNVGAGASHAGGLLQQMFGMAGGMALVETVKSLAGQVVSLGREAFDAVASYERLSLSLESLVAREIRNTQGIADMSQALQLAKAPAADLLGWIETLAIQSPFSQEGVADAFRTAMAYGFTSKEARRLTQATIDYAAASGQGAGVMNQVALALGQIKAKGTLAGQEILQLTNAGIPVRDILAKAFGVTTAELVEMQEKGLIPADKAIEAITASLESDFGGAAKRQATSFAGLTESLGDLKKISLRSVFTGVFQAAQPYISAVVDKLSDPAFQAALTAIGTQLGGTVANGLQQLGTLITPLLPQVQALFGQAMAAAPGILASVGETLTSLQSIWQSVWPTLQATFAAVWPLITDAIRLAGPLIQQVGAIVAQVVADVAPLVRQVVTEAAALIRENLPAIQRTISEALTAIKIVWDAVWPYLEKVLRFVWENVKTIVQTAINIISDVVHLVLSILKGDWQGAWDSVKQIVFDVWEGIKQLVQNGINFIADLFGIKDWGALGRGIVEGIKKGIESAWKWLTDTVSRLAQSALDAAKRVLGISSPSRVAAEMVGEPFVEGIIAGIRDATRLLPSVIPALTTQLTSPALSLSPVSVAQGSINIVVNVQGSVLSARGLAEDVRQELIRTMKRNGSVGF